MSNRAASQQDVFCHAQRCDLGQCHWFLNQTPPFNLLSLYTKTKVQTYMLHGQVSEDDMDKNASSEAKYEGQRMKLSNHVITITRQ